MIEQNFVLITRKGKIPVVKKPMETTPDALIKLMDECQDRQGAEDEIRTVCIIDEYGEFSVYGEQEFIDMFATNTMRVKVDDKTERRGIEYVSTGDVNFIDGTHFPIPHRPVPVLSAGEELMHTADGTVHIVKKGLT